MFANSHITVELVLAGVYATASVIFLIAASMANRNCYGFVTRMLLLLFGGRGAYYFALVWFTRDWPEDSRNAELNRPLHFTINIVAILLVSCYSLAMILRENAMPAGHTVTWYGKYVRATRPACPGDDGEG